MSIPAAGINIAYVLKMVAIFETLQLKNTLLHARLSMTERTLDRAAKEGFSTLTALES